MGIEQTKSLLKTFYSSPPSQGENYLKMAFNTECLQLDEFINFYWKERSTEHLGLTNISSKSLINERDKEKYNLKEELLFPEINSEYQNPEKAFNIESLAEYRNYYIPENTNKFTKLQMKRMNVLLFVYVKKILEDFNENSTIECISKYFDSIMINKDKVDTNSLGINLFIKLVSDISKGNVQIKEKNLDFMLENNKFIRPLSFYGETKEHFILDKALDKIIDYLKDIISDDNEKNINKMKALKIIFNLALAKGSLKNLLDVISYIDKLPQKNIDLNYELNLFKNEFRKFGLGEPKNNNKSMESQVWNYSMIKTEEDKNFNQNNDKSKEKIDYYTITNDGTYLYFFCSQGILLKIGTGFNNTMLGKVYNKKENYRVGEKATIAYVEGILYYRSNNLDPDPVISIDPETLEEIPNKFSVDYSEINHLFVEEKRIEIEFPHTSNKDKDMNEIIERKKNAGLEDKSNLRPSDSSPMISDGRFIYIVSKWFDSENEEDKREDEDEPEENINNKDLKGKIIYGINIYDPLNNMCHVRCLQLIPILSEKPEKNKENESINNNKNNYDRDGHVGGYFGRGRGRGRGGREPLRGRGNFFADDNLNRVDGVSAIYEDQINEINKNQGKEDESQIITLPKDFLQGQNKLYTNGAIIYINQYKFSLVTGQLLGFCDLNSNKTNTFCYDFNNNLIWCANRDTYINDRINITSFYNESAKLNYEYPKGHKKYSPGNIEKIIEFCEKNINLNNLKEEVTNTKYKYQETLDILGLEDEQTKDYKKVNIINKEIEKDKNYEQYKLNLQCFILNIIAKVSEYYGQVPNIKIASNDVERGKILSQAMRRPYCVKLEPNTFKELIKLMIQYSQNFIKGNYTDTEAFCLLAIVKIISTNLKCLSISNLGIDYFLNKKNSDNDSTNPFIQMREFIFNIIKIYHENKLEKNDLFKSVYEECKIILKVSFDTLYQKSTDIVQILCDNLNKSEYSKDIASCILHWMSVPDNIYKILKNADEETMNKIFFIFQNISELEVLNLEKYLEKNKEKFENIKNSTFTKNEFENVSFKFISSLQLELLKSLSKRLINDQYEDSYYEKLVHNFTQILFNNLTKIFISIKYFVDDAISIVNKNYKTKYMKNIYSKNDINTIDDDEDDEEEDMICTSSKKNKKEDDEIVTNNISNDIMTKEKEKNEDLEYKNIPSLEEYRNNEINNIYNNFIIKQILNNLFHIKILTFHLNSLSILSSDYILSAYLLQDFIPLIKEINEIYTKISSCCQIQVKEILVKNDEYKERIYESEHPYVSGASIQYVLDIPGQKGPLYLEFDEKCEICKPDEANSNSLYFYKDTQKIQFYFPDLTKINKEFPKRQLELKTLPCYMVFNAYNQNTSNCYGFKLKIHNGKDLNVKKEVSDNFFDLIRLLNWVGCKCAAVIIHGIFMKLPQSLEGNEKYDELLKNILFQEGINLSEILNEKEKILHNIIEIFSSYDEISPDFNLNFEPDNDLLKQELNLFNDETCEKTLKIFQKKLVSKNIVHSVGGDNGFKLVKICFLAMIHHTGEMKDFIENILGKNEEEIFKSKYFESLFKKYTLASQMRSWLVEKKKNIAESIEKQNKENENNEDNINELENKVESYIKKVINQAANKSKLLIKINNNKNIEEEKDINNICTSVISYFKENISYKRLQRNIKIYTIRAIGRQIGIKMIYEIFKSISNGILLQDLLSWFNTSLRYNNTNFENGANNIFGFNSYLDNILGCGNELKNSIKNIFHNFLDLLIKKFVQNSDEKELDSFLDTLIWKYDIQDHEFLIQKNVFSILSGMQNDTIKSAWGKSYLQLESNNTKDNLNLNKQTRSSIDDLYNQRIIRTSEGIFVLVEGAQSIAANYSDLNLRKLESMRSTIPLLSYSKNLTNEVLEVFEILSSICIDSIIENSQKIIDRGITSVLVQNIINIIFAEIEKATRNYIEYRGISKHLVNQYHLYIEEGNNKEILKKKEKDKKVEEMLENIRQERREQFNEELQYEEDSYYEDSYTDGAEADYIESGINRQEIERRVSDLERKKLEKEPNIKTPEKNYYFTQSDIENTYENAENLINLGLKKEKKIYATGEEILGLITTPWSVIYNPTFLNRLLRVLYKISIQNNNILIKCINSSQYIYSLLKLTKYCSTPEKVLSAKILGNLSLKTDLEDLDEVVKLYYDDYGKKFNNFIELLINHIYLIRKKSWKNGEFNSTGDYILSNYFIKIIRDFISNNQYITEINNLIKNINISKCKTTDDYIKIEIIINIIGIDYFGQAQGSHVLVPNPLSNSASPFDFNSKNDEIKPISGTIIGFSKNMNELFGITESSSKKLEEQNMNNRYLNSRYNINNENIPKKEEIKGGIYITPNNDIENKVGILLDNSLINKENFNIKELFPNIFNQYMVMPIITSINYENLKIDQNIIDYFVDYLEKNIPLKGKNFDGNELIQNNNNTIINLCTNIIKFLYSFYEFYSNKTNEKNEIKVSEKLVKLFMNHAKKEIFYEENYMNLEFTEEKLYRIINYCNENKESLEEIPKISLKFISTTNYLFRLYNGSNKNISLSNSIISVENKLVFNQLIDNGYQSFYIFSSKEKLLKDMKAFWEKNFILILDKNSNIELKELYEIIKNNKNMISNYIIINDQLFNKSITKDEKICYIQISDDELKEIIDIMTELNNKSSNEEYKNEILKMFFAGNEGKNEKEKLLDELTKDFGFDKESVENAMNENPDLDLNDIISSLLKNDNKEDEQNDINIPNNDINMINEAQNNINLINYFGMRNESLFGNPSNILTFDPTFRIGNENQILNNNIIDIGHNNNAKDKKKKNKKNKKDKEKETEEDLIEKKIKDEDDEIKGKKDKKKGKKNKKNEDEDEKDIDKEEDEKDINDEEESEKEEEIEIQLNKESHNEEKKENNDDDNDESSESEKIEKEEKNDCFGFENENKSINFDVFEKTLFMHPNLDKSNLFMIYKSLNRRIQILYSRRIILSILKLCLNSGDENNLNIFLESISKEELYNIIKLLVHEGFFIKSMELGSDLLLLIKNLLLKLNSSKILKNKEIISYFISKSLEDIKYANESPSLSYKTTYINEAEIYEKPYIFFNVWIIMIFSDLKENKEINNIHKEFYNILNLLSCLITKIKENKEIRWFIMDTLITYCQSILSILNSRNNSFILDLIKKENISKFESIPNILKLQAVLKESMSNEGMDNLSKRTQMISEILILIASIDKKIKNIRENEINIIKKNRNNIEDKFILEKLDKNSDKYKELYGEKVQGELQNFIYELLLTKKIMKNFFKMDYLRYLAWKEMNQEKNLEKEIIIESKHLYSKAPVTYLLEKPNVSNYEIKIDPISYLDEDDMIIFSSDKNCKNILKSYTNEEEKNFSIKSPFVYVTFPCSYISKLYAFGINNYGKLGISSDIKEISTPKIITQLASFDIADIKIGENGCIILDKKGEIYTAGYGGSVGIDKATEIFKIPEKYRKENLINNEKVNFIELNNNNVLVNTKDGNLWTFGNLNSINMSTLFNTGNKNEIMKFADFKTKLQINSMSHGTNHIVFTTTDGKLYFIGSNDKSQSGQSTGLPLLTLTPKEISFKKSDFYIMASAGDLFSAFIVKNKKTGKKNLYTAGWSKDGRNGIDEKGEFHSARMFEDENNKNREFIFVSTSDYTGAAISDDGKLYTWGENIKGECGHGNYNNIKVPTLVKFFDKEYFVTDVKCIQQATIVIAKNLKNGKTSLFCMGDNSQGRLGIPSQGKFEVKDTLPVPILNHFFEGKNPEKIYGGAKGVIVKCKVENVEERRENFNCSCEDCGENIRKKMGYNLTEKKILCEKCEEKDEYKNNDIIIFKAKLKEKSGNLIHKKIEEIFKEEKIEKNKNEEKIICEGCNQEIIISENEKYFYSYYISDDENSFDSDKNRKIKRKNICSYCLDHFPPCLTNIKIFYKQNSTSDLISEKSLEKLLNEDKYYEISTSYGYKLSISLTLNDEGCEHSIAKHQKELESFTKGLKEVNKYEIYEQFVDYLNDMSQKAEKSLFSYNEKELTFKKENLSVRNELVNCSNEVLKKMFVLLKILNTQMTVLLPLIDFSKSLSNSERLSSLFNSVSPLIFWEVKNKLIQYFLDKTHYPSVSSQLRINRFKAKKFIEKGKPDLLGEHTIWGQVFQFLRAYPPKSFRKKKFDKNLNNDRNNKLFNATFIGEGSIDAGGPYRECLSSIYSELQSSALSLFIPTSNQKNDTGSFREKWTVNPGALSHVELEMFKVFGGLMGYAIRTGEFFNMDLCSIFWKSILDIEKDEKDLEKFDKYCVQFLDNVEHINDEESFAPYTEYKFTTTLTNGTEVELCKNGNNKFLSLANKKEFKDLVLKARLNEGNMQVQSIRNGLEQVIPSGLLKLLSWNELEMLVCGKPILDIELLKDNTQYNGCSINDKLIQNFWKCLEEFSAEERASYLRFVWGRSRLPLTSKDFPMQHRIRIKSHPNPDLALPTSHTCFFSIDLPRYSSYEVLKNKLKYAITHCQAIDTDMANNEIWDDEE